MDVYADADWAVIEEAYMHSGACIDEFLASQDKQQALVVCKVDQLSEIRNFVPADGPDGCGKVVMELHRLEV